MSTPVEVRLGSEIKEFFCCPECQQGKHFYCHLLGQKTSFGTWYCKECGAGVEGRVDVDKLTVQLTGRYSKQEQRLVLLKLRGGNIYLVVEHTVYDAPATQEQLEYYFDQHTCPTNYFRDTVAILIPPDENDPHGLFEYVIDAPLIPRDTVMNTTARKLFEHFGVKP